jgi:hypothetical protein
VEEKEVEVEAELAFKARESSRLKALSSETSLHFNFTTIQQWQG